MSASCCCCARRVCFRCGVVRALLSRNAENLPLPLDRLQCPHRADVRTAMLLQLLHRNARRSRPVANLGRPRSDLFSALFAALALTLSCQLGTALCIMQTRSKKKRRMSRDSKTSLPAQDGCLVLRKLTPPLLATAVSFLSVKDHLRTAALLCHAWHSAAQHALSWPPHVSLRRVPTPGDKRWAVRWSFRPRSLHLSVSKLEDAKRQLALLAAISSSLTALSVQAHTDRRNNSEFLYRLPPLTALTELSLDPSYASFEVDKIKLPALERLSLTCRVTRPHASVKPFVVAFEGHGNIGMLRSFPRLERVSWVISRRERNEAAKRLRDLHTRKLPLRSLRLPADLIVSKAVEIALAPLLPGLEELTLSDCCDKARPPLLDAVRSLAPRVSRLVLHRWAFNRDECELMLDKQLPPNVAFRRCVIDITPVSRPTPYLQNQRALRLRVRRVPEGGELWPHPSDVHSALLSWLPIADSSLSLQVLESRKDDFARVFGIQTGREFSWRAWSPEAEERMKNSGALWGFAAGFCGSALHGCAFSWSCACTSAWWCACVFVACRAVVLGCGSCLHPWDWSPDPFCPYAERSDDDEQYDEDDTFMEDRL